MKKHIPPPAVGKLRDVFNVKRVSLAELENNGALLTLKDIAAAFVVHPRTVKRLWKRLNVPPLIARSGCHRWTYQQAQTLLHRWHKLAEQSAHVRSWNNGKISGLN